MISRLGDTDKKGDEHRMIAATAFADLGFDVDVGPIVQTPEQVARQAVDADVHAIGARNLLMKHMTLIPDLFSQLKQLDRSSVVFVFFNDSTHSFSVFPIFFHFHSFF
ncbi:unnamed protein product, partial [Anisakis simplex]